MFHNGNGSTKALKDERKTAKYSQNSNQFQMRYNSKN